MINKNNFNERLQYLFHTPLTPRQVKFIMFSFKYSVQNQAVIILAFLFHNYVQQIWINNTAQWLKITDSFMQQQRYNMTLSCRVLFSVITELMI